MRYRFLTSTVALAAVALLALGLMLAAPLTAQAASYNPALPVSMQYKDILTRSGVTILLTILNYRGVRLPAGFQDIATYGKLAICALFITAATASSSSAKTITPYARCSDSPSQA